MRRPKLLITAVLVFLAVGAIALKLFTTEVYLPDDPTEGVIARTEPGWSNRMLAGSDFRWQDHTVLTVDENAYIGRGLYRGLVGWGWILLAGIAVASAMVPARRR